MGTKARPGHVQALQLPWHQAESEQCVTVHRASRERLSGVKEVMRDTHPGTQFCQRRGRGSRSDRASGERVLGEAGSEEKAPYSARAVAGQWSLEGGSPLPFGGFVEC